MQSSGHSPLPFLPSSLSPVRETMRNELVRQMPLPLDWDWSYSEWHPIYLANARWQATRPDRALCPCLICQRHRTAGVRPTVKRLAVLFPTWPRNVAAVVVSSRAMDWKNKLYFGDNLNILRERVLDASIDLIYLDPPFNSNANSNVLFKEKSSEESAAQITAFEDTWQWSLEAQAVYKEIVTSGPRLA
jgi:hypothetical protein